MAVCCTFTPLAPLLRALASGDFLGESPSAIISIFKTKYHLKVKGDGKLNYHLGGDYFEDPDGTFVS